VSGQDATGRDRADEEAVTREALTAATHALLAVAAALIER
jgi:hypothetical protein